MNTRDAAADGEGDDTGREGVQRERRDPAAVVVEEDGGGRAGGEIDR